MKTATVVVLVLLALAGAFAALNQTVLWERKAVQVPWGTVEIPLMLTLLGIAGAALLLILTGLEVEMHARA